MNIDQTFIHGANFKHGFNVIIEPDVTVGDDVTLGHNVCLKSGTRVYSDVQLADYVKTTGLCIIGNQVAIRTGACISRSVIINDKAFIGPGVMTNHTKNVMHQRDLTERQLITEIGYGAVIGSMVSLLAGIQVGPNVVVAAGSNVIKNILKKGIYGGNPVRLLRELDEAYILPVPTHPSAYQEYSFAPALLGKYLPKYQG